MSRIAATFRKLKKEKKKAFIAFLMGGDPNLKMTESLIYELEKQGVDMIEIGVPFSDPIADGPTIQRAGQRALRNGVSLRAILSLVKKVRKKSDIPLLIMSYYNPVFKFGLKNFLKQAKASGLDGLIIPDLIPEEGKELIRLSGQEGLNLVFFIAPTSTRERIRQTNFKSRGFIYCISLLGVTGERKEVSGEVKSFLYQIRRQLKIPLAVGFGISTPEQARAVAKLPGVSGVIVGSAIVKKMEKSFNKKNCVKEAGNFVASLVQAVKK